MHIHPLKKPLRAEIKEAATQAQAILAAGEANNRELTDSERHAVEGFLFKAKAARERLDRIEKDEEAHAELDQLQSSEALGQTVGLGDGHRALPRSGHGGSVKPAAWLPAWPQYLAQQNTGEGSEGAYAVPAPTWSAVIEELGPQSALLASNPPIFTMNSMTLSIPKIESGVSAAWTEENAEISPGEIAFGKVELRATKLGAFVVSSNEWMADSVGNPRALLEQNLERQIARELDRAFFAGDGQDAEPLGLLNIPEIASQPGSSLDDIALAIGRVEAAFAVPRAIYMSPAVWSLLRTERTHAGVGEYLLGNSAGESPRERIFGVPLYLSPALGTKVLVADTRAIAIGRRETASLLYDPYSRAQFDQVAIRCTSRWAIDVLHAAALQIVTDLPGVVVPETPEPETPETP